MSVSVSDNKNGFENFVDVFIQAIICCCGKQFHTFKKYLLFFYSYVFPSNWNFKKLYNVESIRLNI